MNMAEFSKALATLPMTYKVLNSHEVQMAHYKGMLILSHPEMEPIVYGDEKEWRVLVMEECAMEFHEQSDPVNEA